MTTETGRYEIYAVPPRRAFIENMDGHAMVYV